jgi:hypothetical protein
MEGLHWRAALFYAPINNKSAPKAQHITPEHPALGPLDSQWLVLVPGTAESVIYTIVHQVRNNRVS